MADVAQKALPPMAAAAVAFAEIDARVESAETLDDRLRRAFDDAHEELRYRVDKRIAMEIEIQLRIAAELEGIAFYQKRHEERLDLLERFKARVRAELDAAPGVEFRGNLGKIWIQNEGERLQIDLRREIKPDDVAELGIPPEYLCVTTIPARQVVTVDRQRVEADLRAGKELKWARITRGSHIRFPPKPKAKTLPASDAVEVQVLESGES